jgi:hypothetical protein
LRVRSGGVDLQNPFRDEETEVFLLLGDLRIILVLNAANDLITVVERLYCPIRITAIPVL